jgi:AcrR family transcriptional regulator
MYLMSSTRDRLLTAAKDLIWERGVEASSPAAVLARSGVGHGSLYHHFPSKPAWAACAIAELAADLTAETDAILADQTRSGADRLANYLTKPRAALRGCRLGRLAFDPEVATNIDLRAPITAYFHHLGGLLRDALRQAREEGRLASEINVYDAAAMISAVVQGGYVAARLTDDPAAQTGACRGLLALLLGLPPT